MGEAKRRKALDPNYGKIRNRFSVIDNKALNEEMQLDFKTNFGEKVADCNCLSELEILMEKMTLPALISIYHLQSRNIDLNKLFNVITEARDFLERKVSIIYDEKVWVKIALELKTTVDDRQITRLKQTLFRTFILFRLTTAITPNSSFPLEEWIELIYSTHSRICSNQGKFQDFMIQCDLLGILDKKAVFLGSYE